MIEEFGIIGVGDDPSQHRLEVLAEVFKKSTLPSKLYEIGSVLTDYGPNDVHSFYVRYTNNVYGRDLLLSWYYGKAWWEAERVVRARLFSNGEFILSTGDEEGQWDYYSTFDQTDFKKMMIYAFDEGW